MTSLIYVLCIQLRENLVQIPKRELMKIKKGTNLKNKNL